jgi:hypothetical protein
LTFKALGPEDLALFATLDRFVLGFRDVKLQVSLAVANQAPRFYCVEQVIHLISSL